MEGTELRARAVVSNAHPKITFCELVESSQLPTDFVRAIDRYKTRSGTVKVNLALAELPRFDGLKPEDARKASGSLIRLCDSMEYRGRASTDAKYGQPSAAPDWEGLFRSVFDDSLA